VGLTGKQKAAMLLMSLDAATAAELLKGVDAEVVQDLAVELAYLNAAGYSNSKESFQLAQQFCGSLQGKTTFRFNNFLNQMLRSTLGGKEAERIHNQIRESLQKRDPFLNIRLADSQAVASVLAGEHPQAVAVVLSALDSRKSSEVMGLLDEGIRLSAISRMTGNESVTAEAKARIAEMVGKRLEAVGGAGEQIGEQQPLRKVAMILRNMGKELRDGLLEAIQQEDSKAGNAVSDLMVLWSDISQVADKSLQKALRRIDSRKLALALTGADEAVSEKIKSNISERAAIAVDEEGAFIGSRYKRDIEKAREEIVKVLREMNEVGELTFIE